MRVLWNFQYFDLEYTNKRRTFITWKYEFLKLYLYRLIFFFFLLNIFDFYWNAVSISVDIMKLLLFNLNANIRIIGKLLLPGDTIMNRNLTSKFQNISV